MKTINNVFLGKQVNKDGWNLSSAFAFFLKKKKIYSKDAFDLQFPYKKTSVGYKHKMANL